MKLCVAVAVEKVRLDPREVADEDNPLAELLRGLFGAIRVPTILFETSVLHLNNTANIWEANRKLLNFKDDNGRML